ncbi:6-bladed beta-propeller [Pedobacter frigiditerrae]|uniref:6-bladed beta-propeller n=1 Tax=Pedobacter frigiditerrae TaxID=2530452 RepID=A0A4R0MU28_9SPHI|nr:6-bladed beta-propeller [Pedobacter frigiditerrae]TCC90595.1 6-bladed beta-propeller [Pedobacter frigiditerrae]
MTSLKTICTFILLLNTFVSVSQQKGANQDERTFRIDPSDAIGANISQVFSSVNYIPLETTKGSVFGHIKQLEVTEKYFIILDDDTNCILLFTKNGKFYQKIAGGNPSNQGNRIQYFTVNKWRNEIIYLSRNERTLKYFNFEGKNIKNVPIASKEAVSLGQISKFINSDIALTYNDYNSNYSGKRNLILFIDSLGNIKDQQIPFNAENITNLDKVDNRYYRRVNLNFSKKFDGFLFTHSYDYNIYKVSLGHLDTLCRIIFPAKLGMADDFLSNDEYYNKADDYFSSKNPSKINFLSNVYLIGNNLVFKWWNNKKDNLENLKNLIYNTKSGTLYAFNHILPDASNYYLPIFDSERAYEDFIKASSQDLNVGETNVLYSSISSQLLFSTHKDRKDKKTIYSPELISYFKVGKMTDNPVLVELKLRDAL